MLVHTIRLREPWTRVALEGSEQWTRRFAAPTGIGSAEQVFLAIGELPVAAQVLLNGQELGRLDSGKNARWEITNSLMPRNEICLALDPTASGESGSGRDLMVRIEIETGA
jgi:hypothetical protein